MNPNNIIDLLNDKNITYKEVLYDCKNGVSAF